MYSLIIIEDEYATRNALANLIHWDTYGYRVAEVFANGKDALEYLKTGNIPDVILSDIEMPNGNGLEIANFVQKYHLGAKIVFLTGYRDFSYAQQALEYGVEKYLLKPVNPSKIRDTFQEIKNKLDEDCQKEDLRSKNEAHYNEIMDYEKGQFISDLFFGALLRESEIEKRMRLLHLENKNNRLVLTNLSFIADSNFKSYIQNYGLSELQEQIVQILNCFNEKVEYYPVRWISECVDSLLVQGVFWLTNNTDSSILNFSEVYNAIYNLTEIKTKMVFWKEVKDFYSLALQSQRIIDEKTEDALSKDTEFHHLISDQRRLLCSYLHQNNVELGTELTDTLLHNYMGKGVAFAQKYCIDTIIHLLDEIWGKEKVEIRENLFEKCIDKTVLAPMSQEMLFSWMRRCIQNIFEERNKMRLKNETSLGKVMEYIRMHYAEEITLSQIGENVYMNPSYISRMVKIQTGKNVTELVTKMRIERAEELLQTTDLRVYKIAEMVGYNNLQYFYRVFRKITGKAPNDYRLDKGTQ